MSRILHDEQLSDKLDAFLNAGCDFARAWFQSWLARQVETRAGAVELVKTPAQGERPLTLDELAARLGRNKRTIQEWEKDFGLPSLRAHPTADPLFDWPEVVEWMKRHRKKIPPQTLGNGKLAAQAPIGTRPQAKLR